MMKILHTADWHLGKRLENFSRLEEQQAVLAEICSLAEQHDVDVVIIAGDIYDSFKPPVEAEDLFYKTAKRLADNGRRAVIVIAGNHDSPDRILAPEPLARECGIILSGYPNGLTPEFELEGGLKVLRSEEGFVEVKLPKHDAPLRLLLTPYANELRLRSFLGTENAEAELRKLLEDRWRQLADKYCDNKGVNILAAHLLLMRNGGEMPEEPESERSIVYVGGAQAVFTENIPAGIQYVALGHLHRLQTIDTIPCPVVYSGSPLSYSMSEAGQEKCVLLLNAEPGKAIRSEKLSLAAGLKLERKKFTEIPVAVDWLQQNHDTIVELTLETENYLTADERRQIAAAHPRIIGPIPIVKNTASAEVEDKQDIRLDDNLTSLFKNYFRSRYNQEPNDELMVQFAEVLAVEGEE